MKYGLLKSHNTDNNYYETEEFTGSLFPSSRTRLKLEKCTIPTPDRFKKGLYGKLVVTIPEEFL
jgi:hypothetical protein